MSQAMELFVLRRKECHKLSHDDKQGLNQQ